MILFVAFLLLPGIALGELFALWKKELSLVQRLGLAFLLGTAFDVSATFILLNTLKKGITIYEPTLVLVIAVSLLGVSLVLKGRFLFPIKPSKNDIVILALFGILSLLVWGYLQQYPIFPAHRNIDFILHMKISSEILNARGAPQLTDQLLYYGAYYLISSNLALTGGEPLFQVRYAVAILAVFSILPVHLVASRLFSSERAGVYASILYLVGGFVWYGMVFNTGIYPNFYGILASMFLIYTFIEFTKRYEGSGFLKITLESIVLKRSLAILTIPLNPWFAILVLALLNAYLSHYSTLTLLPALFAFILLYGKSRNFSSDWAFWRVIPLALPPLIGLFLFPGLLGTLLGFTQTNATDVPGLTHLARALSFFPALSYIVTEITNDAAAVFLFAFAGVAGFEVAKSRDAAASLPLLWFVAILAMSPWNSTAWRFSYEALLPLILLSSYGFHALTSMPRMTTKFARYRAGYNWKFPVAIIAVLFLAAPNWPAIAGQASSNLEPYSLWGLDALPTSEQQVNLSVSSQREVYQAIIWMKANIHENFSALSLTDWRFVYSPYLGSRAVYYAPDQKISIVDPLQVILHASRMQTRYIIVTTIYTVPGVPPELNPGRWTPESLRCYSSDCLVYKTSDVKIFDLWR